MVSLIGRPTRRDRVVSAYVRRELYPHTEAGRARIDASSVMARKVRSVADLAGVEPVELSEVGDGGAYVVRPTRQEMIHSGSPYMRLRTVWASTWGRWAPFVASIEPKYRPVHFFTADGVPVGAAAADLVRLAGLGIEWLRSVGVTRSDSIALVGGAGSGIEAWELSGGTRRGGISLAVVEDAAGAARHRVTVCAGSQEALVAALANGTWPELRLVIVLGETADTVDARLAKLGLTDDVAVRRAWAPAGTRSVWYECRGGDGYGWHTTPSAELVELHDHDEVVWTGLGWAGTVFFRLRTDVRAHRVDSGPCAACGHVGPRLVRGEGRPSLARWLRADSRVADARLTSKGADVLPARAGPNARLLADAGKLFPGETITVKTKRGWVVP